jgi:hypothetical protein
MKNIHLIHKTLFVLLSILLISCYSEPSAGYSNKLMSFGEFTHEMAKQKGSGTILIQSNDYLTTQERLNNINVSERSGKPNSIQFNGPDNQSFNILGRSQTENTSLFGNRLNYAIQNGTKNSMYIPKLLKVRFDSNELKEGMVVSWNADDLNSRGVVIWITYKPTNQLYSIAKDNMNYITDGLVTEDNGSYRITKDDLARFPESSQVTLNVLRTNFDVNEINLPSLIAFTTIANDFQIKK